MPPQTCTHERPEVLLHLVTDLENLNQEDVREKVLTGYMREESSRTNSVVGRMQNEGRQVLTVTTTTEPACWRATYHRCVSLKA